MKRPNILYIMSDDHAANAISAYGSRLANQAPTPNIDRIADSGIRMDNCFCTNAICTPSRAVVLTGQHSHVNGVKTLSDPLDEKSTLLSELLKNSGYKTALFGKWHLHAEPRGFDDWAVLPGQGEYNDPSFIIRENSEAPAILDVITNKDSTYTDEWTKDYDWGKHIKAKGYVTDVITDLTLDWLEEQNSEKPFFLCCHHKAPHDFFEYKRVHEDIYKDTSFNEPSTLFEDEKTREEISRKYGTTVSERWEPRNMVKHLSDPNYPNGGAIDFSGKTAEEKTKIAYQKYIQDYLRTVHAIDQNVGRILDYLENSGQMENTIVIYTSDQGMMLGEHDHIDKRWIFDESQQMPLLISYPNGIKKGITSDDVVDNVDFAPTLLDYAGINRPNYMQGRSFKSVLEQETPKGWRQSVYYRYWMHMAHHWVPAHFGIRTQEWKLIFFYGKRLDASGCEQPDCLVDTPPGFELYDVKNDPEEKVNLVSDTNYSDVLSKMKSELMSLKKEVGDSDSAYPEMMEMQNKYFNDSY
ncbi:MAG: sulfatase [Spirochaetaceae bacterium]